MLLSVVEKKMTETFESVMGCPEVSKQFRIAEKEGFRQEQAGSKSRSITKSYINIVSPLWLQMGI